MATTRMSPQGPGFPTLRLSLDFHNPSIPHEGRHRAVGIGRMIQITLGVEKAGIWGRPPADSVRIPAKREWDPTQTDPLSAPQASRFTSDGKHGMYQPSRSERKGRAEGRHKNRSRTTSPSTNKKHSATITASQDKQVVDTSRCEMRFTLLCEQKLHERLGPWPLQKTKTVATAKVTILPVLGGVAARI